MRNYLLLSVLLLSGCASAGVTGTCLNIQGTEMSIPYLGGKVNANGVMCHIGCDAFGKCTQPTPADLVAVMVPFSNNKAGQLAVPSAGTITFTPSK